MQHKRDKNGEPPEPTYDRQSCVELLELELLRRRPRELTRGPDGKSEFLVGATRPDDPLTLTMPRYAWEHIVACAKAGQHKRQGRPSDTRGDKLRKNAIVAFARQRKNELIATGTMAATGADSAEDQAVEEARVLANERYGLNLATETIRRLMQAEPDE